MEDRIITAVRYYINENYSEPDTYYGLKRERFKKKVYDVWAGKRVLNELRRYENTTDYIEVLTNFVSRIEYYRSITKTEDALLIFSCLYNVTINILDFLASLIE